MESYGNSHGAGMPGRDADSGSAARQAAMLSACRRALGEAGNALPTWRPLLRRAQAVFDESSSRLEALAASVPQLAARGSNLEASFRAEERAAAAASGIRVRAAETRAAAAEDLVSDLRGRLADAEELASTERESRAAAERVQSSLKDSNETLVSAYRRAETSAADADRRAGDAVAESAAVRRGADSLADEVAELKLSLKTMTRRMKGMVPHADLLGAQRQLQTLRAELGGRRRLLAVAPASDAGAPAPATGTALDAPSASEATSAPAALQALCEALGVPWEADEALVSAMASGPNTSADAQEEGGETKAPGGADGAADGGSVVLPAQAILSLLRGAQGARASPPSSGASSASLPRIHGAATLSASRLPRTTLVRSAPADAGPAGGDAGAARRPDLEATDESGRPWWCSTEDPVMWRGVPLLPPTHPSSRPRFLLPRGSGEDVPRFLRSNGLVRAHDLSKQDVERLVKACWAAKSKHEGQLRRQREDDSLHVPLVDFFWEWLRATFGGPGQAVEWGCSVVHALQKYAYDADVDVFLRCLQGRLPEDVFAQGNLLVQRLEHGLRQRDRSLSGGQTTGFLTVDDIRAFVREVFPHKETSAVKAVLAALAIDPAVQAASGAGAAPSRVAQRVASQGLASLASSLNGSERVDYTRLLAENAVGDQGPFVETLRAQLVSDFLRYASELTKALKAAAVGPSEEGMQITPAAAMAAIRKEDPTKPEHERLALVARGAGLHPSELNPESSTAVMFLEFMDRLRSGWLARTGAQVGRKDRAS